MLAGMVLAAATTSGNASLFVKSKPKVEKARGGLLCDTARLSEPKVFHTASRGLWTILNISLGVSGIRLG